MATTSPLAAAAALAVLLASLSLPAGACPFAQMGGSNRRLRAAAGGGGAENKLPGAKPDPAGQGAFVLPGGGLSRRCSGLAPPCDGSSTSPTWIEVLQYVKSQVLPNEDMCYWSFQTLPPPEAGEELYDYAAIPDQAEAVQDMGFTAWDRLAEQAVEGNCTHGCGLVVWAGTTPGADLVQYLCATNTSVDPGFCTDAHLFEEWRWPTASAIFRFNGSNTDALLSLIRWWRSSDDAHGPMIGSELFSEGGGWGTGGMLSAKLFKCSDIPAAFHTTTYPPPPLSTPTASGKSIMDEALEFWVAYPGLMVPGMR